MGMSQFSKTSYILFGCLLLLLLGVKCSSDNLEAKGGLKKLKNPVVAAGNGTKSSNLQKGRPNSGSDDIIAAPIKKQGQLESSKEFAQKDFMNNNVTKPLDSKGGGNQKVPHGNSDVEVKDKVREDDISGRLTEGFGSGSEAKKDGSEERSSSSMGVGKEKLRDEECDPSNMCVDEKRNFTACLRVPGDDSPDLFLQIRNKGTKSVTITITAPAFVQLEEATVQLQPKKDTKVKATLGPDGVESLIFLTTEDSRCTLDFKELIPQNSRADTRSAFNLSYVNALTRTRSVIFLTLTAFLVFGCVGMYFGLRKKISLGNGYQKAEMELPVSDVQKRVSDANDGWENDWDDRWDDEEAPMTPTLPATPNLSSRGLASRRLSKEGWKD